MNQIDFFLHIKEIAKILVKKGWAESNSGNFSYRLDKESFDKRSIYNNKKSLECSQEITTEMEIFISNRGAKFREMRNDVFQNCGVIRSKNGEINFYCSSEEYGFPSSEYLSHLYIQQHLMQNHPEYRVVLHTHPTFLIAFSHRFAHYSKEQLNYLLENAMTEVKLHIPKQTGFVDSLQPGSSDLAEKSLIEFKQHDITVWKRHGCTAVANNFWQAFDMIDVLEKAAQIVLLSGVI